MKFYPKRIPGIPIRPPEKRQENSILCKNCHRALTKLRKVIDPISHKVKLVCPFCGREI